MANRLSVEEALRPYGGRETIEGAAIAGPSIFSTKSHCYFFGTWIMMLPPPSAVAAFPVSLAPSWLS